MEKFFNLITNDPTWMYILGPILLLFFAGMLISAYIDDPDRHIEFVGGYLGPVFMLTIIMVFYLLYTTQ